MIQFSFLFSLIFSLFSHFVFAAEQKPCEWKEKRPGLEWQACGNVNILRLSGTPSERAYNHGLLIRENKLSPDVFNYFSEKIFSPLGKPGPASHWLLEKIYALWVNQLHSPVDPDTAAELKALADGIGVATNAVKRAIVLPDTASFLNGLKAKPWLKFIPPMGCTSVAKKFPRGSATGFAYGRNLDFASTGLWDQHPQITIQIPPPNSNELPHIAFGAPGVQFGGITGVNSAGITFAVHQNYTHSQHLGGWPMFLVGEKVLREARNLREAEAILQRHRTSPIWTFVVSDLKTGEIMAIEMSQNIFRKRMMHDPDASLNKGEFVQTNDLQHAETTPYEFIQPGHLLNSQERFNKALEKLLAWTPQDNNNPYRALQKILSYSARSDGYLNAHQDIIKAHTIQSVIFANPQINSDLKQVRIAVSHEPAPTASGEFISFSLPELFSPQKLLSIQAIPGVANSAIRKEQMSFAKAFAASFDRQDYADAIRLLDKQKAPNALLAKGVFAQKIGRLADAATYFQQAKQASEIKPLPLPHLKVSIDFAILLNRYAQTNDPEQLRPLAAAVLANTQNHWQKKVSSKILERKKLGRLERSLAFDYFSGDLTSEPYTPQ